MGRIDDRGRVGPRRQVHRISAVRLGPGGETGGRTTRHLNQGVLKRRTRIASGDRSTQRSLIGRNRAGKLEGADLGFPAEGSVCIVILVRIPKGRVVRRIQAHRGVIAPAVDSVELDAGSGEHRRLALP